MSQQSFLPEPETEYTKIQNKVILLYMIEKMDLPLTRNQIEKFALEENLMNINTVHNYVDELVAAEYLYETVDNGGTRFTITEEGLLTIDLFLKDIPLTVRNMVLKYVADNRKTVKQDFQVIANYFYDHKNNEYIVKCAIYDDEMMLLEINMSVVSREQALSVCTNWKNNVNTMYGDIIGIMFPAGAKKESQG